MKILKKGILASFIALQLVSCSKDNNNDPVKAIKDDLLKGNVTSIGSQPDLVNISSFSYPSDVAIDQNGDIYVTDTNDKRIKKITLNNNGGSTITTIAGNDSSADTDGIGLVASFNFPQSLVFSKDYKTLYVTTWQKIRAINIDTKEVTTIAGKNGYGNLDGIGTNAEFTFPHHIAINQKGTTLYVSESVSGILQATRVRKIDIASKQVSTLNLTGLPNDFTPGGLALDSKEENLYIANYRNILKVNLKTNKTTILVGSDTQNGTLDGIGTNASFTGASSLTFSPNESYLYVGTTAGNLGIRVVDMETLQVTTLLGNNNGFVNGNATTAKFKGVYELEFDKISNKLYAADPHNKAIRVVE